MSGLAVNARTVVMTLGAVLVLVLGCVLAGLWRQRSRSGIALSLTLGALILVGGVWLFADAIVRTDPAVMRWFQGACDAGGDCGHAGREPARVTAGGGRPECPRRPRAGRGALLVGARRVAPRRARRHAPQYAPEGPDGPPAPKPPGPVIELTSSSFPSSHMATATLFYGFLAVVLLGRVRRRGHRMLIVLATAVLVTLIGVSRLYLGVHYLSDVLAAGAVSLAWLALCHAAVDTWRRTRTCNSSPE